MPPGASGVPHPVLQVVGVVAALAPRAQVLALAVLRLVVEVGDQWIVVGASPGRVNALATMPRQESAGVHPGAAEGATLAPHAPAAGNFADWLKQTLDKRK